MKHSLKTRLTFSYIAIILICVAIVSILTNVILERQFRDYVINQQEKSENEMAYLIENRYAAYSQWDEEYIEDIGINALEKGMIIKISDESGNTVWDAVEHNNGMCEQMISNMQKNMMSRYPGKTGGYEEKVYSLSDGKGEIGTLTIGYYGPYFYTDSDLKFINTLNKLLILTGVISISLALILGIIMSRQISKPVLRVVNKTEEISKGSYGERIDENSNTKEIIQLVDSVNSLADNLKRQENLSKQASWDIAHELRTPLTTVRGNLEAVMDGVMEMDDDRVKVMYDEILRINRLVDDLGKLSKYESESFSLNKVEFDLADLIARTIKSYENDFKKWGKEIVFIGESANVYADKDKINQVLVNLITNANKYTKENGRVEISLEKKDKSTIIKVKDNGIGISEKDLPMVFERFYRADKSRNRQSGGAGIGLTIAKTIVEAHGGGISIQSEEGKGTEVTIII
ncbi:MAG: ATP-binding protein [Eubacteriales bacterium]